MRPRVGIRFPIQASNGRSYLFGRRTHHGLYGCLLILAGVACVVHDWRDRNSWLADFLKAASPYTDSV